jgi:nicotinate-nucleotide pyrophosphorylase (carboxylating)
VPAETLDPTPYLSLLATALAEDLGRGDPTSLAIVPASATTVADLVAVGAGVACGIPLVEPLVRIHDPDATVETLVPDGTAVGERTPVAVVRGRSRAVLGAERTALNFVRRLSGIATLTARFVAAVHGLPVAILDTRKTTPGWRELEKYAVRCGGGVNHRLRLDDAAMIKENHLIAAFGRTGPAAIAEGVRRARRELPAGMRLHVEVETYDELEAVVDEGVDVVMLDGWSIEDLRRAVALVKGRAKRPLLEATGGVSLETVRRIAETGVDRISVGALTHSAPALDLSMRHRKPA